MCADCRNRCFVSFGRRQHAEPSPGRHVDSATRHFGAFDPGNVRCCLCPWRPDADRAAIIGGTLIADVDLVAAVSQQIACVSADRNVIRPVVLEYNVSRPKATLDVPLVFENRALDPEAVLW